MNEPFFLQETLQEDVPYDARAADLFACGVQRLRDSETGESHEVLTCSDSGASFATVTPVLGPRCVIEVVGYALAIGNYPWQSTAGGGSSDNAPQSIRPKWPRPCSLEEACLRLAHARAWIS